MLQQHIQIPEEALKSLLCFVATNLDDGGRPDHHKLAAMAFMPIFDAAHAAEPGASVSVNRAPVGTLLDFAGRFEERMDPETVAAVKSIRQDWFADKLPA